MIECKGCKKRGAKIEGLEMALSARNKDISAFAALKKNSEALIKFLRNNSGDSEDYVIEIKCNGEDSDIYGKHISCLLTDLEESCGLDIATDEDNAGG